MNTEEKLKYVIKILNELINDSKTIGDLPDYTPTNQDNLTTFIGVYDSNTGKTLKVSITDMLAFAATVAVEDHVHEISDIGMLEAAINKTFIDINDNPWSVERNGNNFDFSTLLLEDKISGWTDSNKNTFVQGIILDEDIEIPTDIYDTNKFFITNKKIKL